MEAKLAVPKQSSALIMSNQTKVDFTLVVASKFSFNCFLWLCMLLELEWIAVELCVSMSVLWCITVQIDASCLVEWLQIAVSFKSSLFVIEFLSVVNSSQSQTVRRWTVSCNNHWGHKTLLWAVWKGQCYEYIMFADHSDRFFPIQLMTARLLKFCLTGRRYFMIWSSRIVI